MKKSIKIKLLQSIIETEFFLLLRQSNNTLKVFDKNYSGSKKENSNFLDFFTLLKSLKQFIRILQFLSKNKNSNLHICCLEKQIFNFLKLYVQENGYEKLTSIESTLSKVFSKGPQLQSLLLLGNSFSVHDSFSKRLYAEKILLINTINSTVELNSYGKYKIHNNISDFKKLIFLIAIIQQIFLKTK